MVEGRPEYYNLNQGKDVTQGGEHTYTVNPNHPSLLFSKLPPHLENYMSIPIYVPSSPWTSEHSGSPTIADSSPPEQNPLLSAHALPPLESVPPHSPPFDIPSTSYITFTPACKPSPSTSHPILTPTWPITPISPVSSPNNSIDSDLDFLLQKKTLDLHSLTIHKPPGTSSMVISPSSAGNITVRRKHNRGN